MKCQQFTLTSIESISELMIKNVDSDVQLMLIFGATKFFRDSSWLNGVRKNYPNTWLMGCSTAGEIFDTQVNDDSLTFTAIKFEHTTVHALKKEMQQTGASYEIGANLAKSLPQERLKHVFVLSDGVSVNGSELVAGLKEFLPTNISVTGGLAGDGSRFKETYVLLNDTSTTNTVAIMGFYGERLNVGYGSLGGWDPFGPERLITLSKGNVLYELDGQSALELYKKYLGEHAADLPASGLLYPLSLRKDNLDTPVVRTILSIDETEQSMTFAGDIPQGYYARLMKANFNRLIDGAAGAAKTSALTLNSIPAQLAILISCVGRKMVLKQRIEEEVEAVREVIGNQSVLTGFYSYGEISPFTPNAKCELHNQTMTITAFSEQ